MNLRMVLNRLRVENFREAISGVIYSRLGPSIMFRFIGRRNFSPHGDQLDRNMRRTTGGLQPWHEIHWVGASDIDIECLQHPGMVSRRLLLHTCTVTEARVVITASSIYGNSRSTSGTCFGDGIRPRSNVLDTQYSTYPENIQASWVQFPRR